MRDRDCIDFLQWALPKLGMRWAGFRKVRNQVCKRIQKRLANLGLPSVQEYRRQLESDPEEWKELRNACRVTISRFYRDRAVFNAIRWEIFGELDAELDRKRPLSCWSCGTASGEEAYTLKIIWNEMGFDRELRIHATDIDGQVLARAQHGVYPESSVRELPEIWRRRYFSKAQEGDLRIRPDLQEGIEWHQVDILEADPGGPFDLVLCRYLVFTYFDLELQTRLLPTLAEATKNGGAFVLGQTEEMPENEFFIPWLPQLKIYRRIGARQGNHVEGRSTRP